MNGACGLTGCRNPVILRCSKCSLPLCAEHAVEHKTADGVIVCCKRCAAYLRAKAQDEDKATTGGGCDG
jgi:hypothetical protein